MSNLYLATTVWRSMSPALLVLLYSYLLYMSGRPAWRYIRVANALHSASAWKPVSAILKDARPLASGEEKRGVWRLIQWIRFGRAPTCFFAVYEVDGRFFGCQTPTLYPYSTLHETAIIKSLAGKEGQTISLFADPQQPHKSCYLNPGSHRTSWLVVKMAFAVCVGILIVLGVGVK